MSTFVLVPGSWHSSWCWERLVPLLEMQGHRVVTPDLLGTGKDKTPLSDVTLARWADQIANLVSAQPEPVVLVGHSRGGMIISEVAERVPDCIQSLVYLTAFLLPNGETLRGSVNMPLPDYIAMAEDGTSTIAEQHAAETFYNSTAPEWVERATKKARGEREPMAVFVTPIQVSEERFGRVPRAYIECTRDHAIPIAHQRHLQAALPCDPVLTLDTDHSPFYSAPTDLADGLISIAKRGETGALGDI